MSDEHRAFEIFLDIQRGLPRQGPGNDAETLRALDLCGPLPESPAVLDIGCGPGMQTVALAKALDGPMTVVDMQGEYLEELRERARDAAVSERIESLAGDMNALPFPDDSFDLIWSEGAAYIMGFANALKSWKRLLRPSGRIAVSELVWLKPNPPAELKAFFANAYPAMTDVMTNLESLQHAGYAPLGHFTLPDEAWWDHYYTPLEEKLPLLRVKYAEDPEGLRLIEDTAREIGMRRNYPDWYGYEFYVGQIQD